MVNVRVGEKVEFKTDVEGEGVVLESLGNGVYLIGSGDVGSCEPWHPGDRYDSRHCQMVVTAHKVWALD